jgi:predicted secreted hydrolase
VKRRELLRRLAAGATAQALLPGAAAVPAAFAASAAGDEVPADVVPGVVLEFPRDHGSHPRFRTEWWYVTGWLESVRGETLGFQVTFFRTDPGLARSNPSAFAPRQLLIGHAAISDVARGRLWKDQRIARAGFGLVEASELDTAVRIDDWRFARRGASYASRVRAEGFGFELTLERTQPPLLNGLGGYSRKGPEPRSASYYYSVPQLAVRGAIEREGRRDTVTGRAWLDHEWSSAYLDAEAAGWDWFALNLADGGALMAFRIRDRRGGTHWAGGSWRRADGTERRYEPAEVGFVPGRRWRSPRTRVEYPVEFRVRLAGDFDLDLVPLLDDQESDTRASTGAIYWEGAVRGLAAGARRELGRGYLELTGYGEALRLP